MTNDFTKVLVYLIERRKKNDTANIPDILTIDRLIEELGDPDCEHLCTSNCRREGCNCDCGEYHKEKQND